MFQKIFFTFVMSFLCFGVVAQEYEKKRGTIRLLTYNTHYCKGAADPGTISEENVHFLPISFPGLRLPYNSAYYKLTNVWYLFSFHIPEQPHQNKGMTLQM